MSKTAVKEEKSTAVKQTDDESHPPNTSTNIVIKTIDSNENKESEESLYDQIKRKYMMNSANSESIQYQTIHHHSSESLNIQGSIGSSTSGAQYKPSGDGLDLKLKQMRREAD